jgi:glutamyl/glutaminyl-tRNA synthetase
VCALHPAQPAFTYRWCSLRFVQLFVCQKHGGVFYLRIEDTDQNRFVPRAEQYIFDALDWLGIAPSETVGKNEKFGPTARASKAMYQQYADALIASGQCTLCI